MPPPPFPTEAFAGLTERRVTSTVMSAQGTWTGAVGRADQQHRIAPDAQMAIGSVTKSIVAAPVMQLVEAGDLALDDPVADHLPAWVQLDTNDATILDLMAMGSGLSDYVDPESLDELNADPRRGAQVGRSRRPRRPAH